MQACLVGISNGCANATACPESFSAGQLLLPNRMIKMDGSAHDLRHCTDERCPAASPPHPLMQKIGWRSLEIHSVFRQKPPESRSD